MSFSINFSPAPVQTMNVIQQTQQTQQPQQAKQFNPHDTAKEFCGIYYSAMASKGLASILYLFDQNVMCNYGGKEYTGMYNTMITMATDGISKLCYDKLNGVMLPLVNSSSISVQVTGLCQGVTFWNQLTAVYTFSETFILTALSDGTIRVSGYSFKLI